MADEQQNVKIDCQHRWWRYGTTGEHTICRGKITEHVVVLGKTGEQRVVLSTTSLRLERV